MPYCGQVLRTLAGEEGFEPSNGGIKIRCLNQLGDSPKLLMRCGMATVHAGAFRFPDQFRNSASGCRFRPATTKPRMPPGTIRSTERACSSVGYSAKTQAPEPLRRASPYCRSHARCAATTG